MKHIDPTKNETTATNISTPSLSILLISRNKSLPHLNNAYQSSSNETIFNESAIFYEETLNKSACNTKLKYTRVINNKTNKKARKKNITWFTSTISKNISTNIRKFFQNLVNKHFPRRHKLHKIFNKNNLKVSYNCMKNIA